MDINWIAQTLTGLAIGVLAYFIKDLKKTIDKRIEQNAAAIRRTDQRVDNLEEKFAEYRERVASKFVQKEEFIRAIATMDTKLDKIYDRVADRKEC